MSHDGSDCKDDWNSGSQSPNCHTDGDSGADFYDAGRGGMAWRNETWSIPTADLEQIYKTMNLPDESSTKIAMCTLTMYIGSVLEGHFASMLTFHYDVHAAFLTEELDLWYHGGLEDMGTNVAWKWQQLTKIFSKPSEKNETSNSTFKNPGCSVFGTGFLRNKAMFYADLLGVKIEEIEGGHHHFSFDKEIIATNMRRTANELFNDLGLQPYSPTKQSVPVESVVGKSMQADKVLNSTKQLSYFGKSIAVGDFDGDGKKDEVFIGAPGYSLKGKGQLGAVYLTKIGASADEYDSADPYLLGVENYGRFGYSLAVLDINHDGVDDLVVSSPSEGPGGSTDIGDYYAKSYHGRIYVYLGLKGFGIKKHASPDFSIRA
jgi:glycosylphosphatidylinositol phospholipase D